MHKGITVQQQQKNEKTYGA